MFQSSQSGRAPRLRRLSQTVALASALMVGLAACSGGATEPATNGDAASSDLSGREMVYASYGGTTEEYSQESWGDPFAAASGAEVIYASPIDLGKVRAMVESGNVEWDLMQGAYTVARAPGWQDLYEDIDLGDFDTSSLIENAVQEKSVGVYVLSFLIAYRTDSDRAENPVTWADFYDTEKFPGKRGVENDGGALILESALLADGVAAEDLYPLDLDRAFSKLDTIKDDIVWYETGAQQQELLQNGTVDYLIAWNGRAYDLIAKGVPVGMSFDHQIAYQGSHVIPKGAPNADMAVAFIKESLKPENQAAFAERTAYAPVNSDALALIDPDVAQHLPTYGDNADTIVWLAEDYWEENLDVVTERWNSWLLE